MDVANRLVAKYKIVNSNKFWGNDFSQLSDEYIYPPDDTFRAIQQEVVDLRNRGFYENTVGDFLKLWNEFERTVKLSVKANEYSSINKAYKDLINKNSFYKSKYSLFNEVRYFRNKLVHESPHTSEDELEEYISILKSLLEFIQKN